jgi:tetratricopeptide (TPR) repeat protein
MKKLLTVALCFWSHSLLAQFDNTVTSDELQAFGKALKGSSEEAVVERAAKILAKDPDHLKTLNGLAVHYFKQKKFGLAKILLKRAMVKHPDESALHNNMALIQMSEGDGPLAISSFRKALSSGSYRMATLNLTSVLLEHRDYARALSPLEEAYSDVKSDLRRGQGPAVDIANNYAVALMGVGEGSKSRQVFEAIIEGGSRDAEVHLNYAILLVDVLGDKKNGQRALSKLQFMTDREDILRQAGELERRAK